MHYFRVAIADATAVHATAGLVVDPQLQQPHHRAESTLLDELRYPAQIVVDLSLCAHTAIIPKCRDRVNNANTIRSSRTVFGV